MNNIITISKLELSIEFGLVQVFPSNDNIVHFFKEEYDTEVIVEWSGYSSFMVDITFEDEETAMYWKLKLE